jgi:mRNA-degrading endonuclease RelE of RelBE toxin-antitoxin system
MEILFKPAFLKDFKKMPPEIRKQVRYICVELFPSSQDILELVSLDIKPLRGFKTYYRIRIGNYRIGFKKENHSVIFMRVLDRRDIYRYFP